MILLLQMQVKESKWLIKCFLNYLRLDQSELNVLFDILSIFLSHSRIDYTFLKEFYIIEVLYLTWTHFTPRCLLAFFLLLVSKLNKQLFFHPGGGRVSTEHEESTSFAFSESFSNKTTWSWPSGDCHANAHSSYACSCLPEWPKLGGCWLCYYQDNCWQTSWSARGGDFLNCIWFKCIHSFMFVWSWLFLLHVFPTT